MRLLPTLLALALLSRTAQSQSFEVASVRPARAGPVKIQSDPGRLTIGNQAVDVLIRLAFGLREYEYEGPAWLHTTRYDIIATTAAPESRSAQLAMLRALLTDRFKLAFHRESKTVPVYELVAGKSGPKLTPVDEKLPTPFELYSNFSIAINAAGVAELRGAGTLGQLSDFLRRVAERPVIDRTGIAGSIEFRLLCAIDGYPGFETSPTVFDAVQSQLGLKLEPRTGKIEITVVDRAEKPAEN